MTSSEKELTEGTTKEAIIPPTNPVFSSATRLTIMLILFFYKKTGFTELQKLLNITPGTLDYHIKKLENENYVRMQKTIFPTRPLNIIKITKHGEESFKAYSYKLRDILNKIK